MLHQATIHLSETDELKREAIQQKHREGQPGYDKFTFKAVFTLIGAFCVHMVIGAQYAWGNIAPYIVGYFRDMGIPTNMSQMFAVLPVIVILSTIVFPLGTKLTPLTGSKSVIFIGSLFCVGFTALATLSRSVTVFFMLYAVGFGIGKGFLYPAPLNAGWSHLPARKGFVSGVVVSAIGIGALSFGIIAKYILNPLNLEPTSFEVAPGVFEYQFPPEVNGRVPEMLFVLCILWTILLSIGLLTVSNFQSPFEQELQSNLLANAPPSYEHVKISSLLLTKDFWQLYAISFFHIFYGYYIMSMSKTLGQTTIRDDQFLTLVASVAALSNGISRIFWSTLLDFYSFNAVYRVLLMIQLLMIATLTWSLRTSPILFFINVCVSYMCEGGITSILPTEALNHFGQQKGQQLYAFLFSSFGVSAIFCSLLVYLVQYEIGFAGMLTISFTFTVISLLLTFVYDSGHKFDYSRFAIASDSLN